MEWRSSREMYTGMDRRYCLGIYDIQDRVKRARASGRLDKVDACSTKKLCTGILASNILMYQPQDPDKNKPLIIIYQSADMKKKLFQHGQGVIFLDTTYKGNQQDNLKDTYTLIQII